MRRSEDWFQIVYIYKLRLGIERIIYLLCEVNLQMGVNCFVPLNQVGKEETRRI